jgi:hypothetical protein
MPRLRIPRGVHVSETDRQVAMRLHHDLSAVTDGWELQQAIMEGLQRLLGGNLVGWNEVDTQAGTARVVHWPAEPQIADLSRRVSATIAEHPTARYYLQTTDRTPTKISDHVPTLRAWRAHPVYDTVFRAIGACHQLTIPVLAHSHPRMAGGYAVNREKGADFREEDRARAAILQAVLVSQHSRLLGSRRLVDDSTPVCLLTRRQLKVLWHVGNGMTQAQLSEHFHVSSTVVKRELASCNQALGSTNAASAVATAIHLGLLTHEEPR